MAIQKFTFLDDPNIASFSKSILTKTNLSIDRRIVRELNESVTDRHIPGALMLKTINETLEAVDTLTSQRISAIEDNVGESGDITQRLTTIEAAVDTNKTDIGTIKDTTIPAVEKSVSDLETKVEAFCHLTVQQITGPITSVTEPKPDVLYYQRDDENDKSWVLYVFIDSNWVVIGDTSIDLENYWPKADVEGLLSALGKNHDVDIISMDVIKNAIDYSAIFTDPFIITADFTVSAENRAMIGYTGAENEELVIPETFIGDDNVKYKVTSITDGAFSGCTSLKSVTIPEDITSIGVQAFDGCTSLKSVNIPKSVTSIGKYAFDGCTTLSSVIMPNNITNIDIGTFYYCIALSSIDIPVGVNDIKEKAFQYCTSLTSVNIPNTVTNIGKDVFWGCNLLSSITIPNSVVTIGTSAFRECSLLTDIDIPESVKTIGQSTFEDCAALKSVRFPEGFTSIGNWMFKNCTSLTSVTIPNTVTSIKDYTFHGCTSLVNIDISNNLTSIGTDAFKDCTSLVSINIDNYPDMITGSPWGASDTTTVNWLRIPPVDFTVTSANRAMVGYTGAENEELVIPETFTGDDGVYYKVVGIDRQAFKNCTSLTSVIIPEGVNCINVAVFYNCSALTSITIPEGVTSIESQAFYGCNSLTSIDIPDTLTNISEKAFSGCWALTSITIPEGVTSIESQAFGSCTSLTSIAIPDTVTSIGASAFSNCSALTSITIPEGVTSIESRAFASCTSLTSITLPNTLTSIGTDVFNYCTSLTSINIDNTADMITGSPWGATNATINWLR